MPLPPHASHRPVPRRWLRYAWLLGPVALCSGGALVLAWRAMPLAGGARLVFACAVALNVGLLALSSWSGMLEHGRPYPAKKDFG